MSNISKSPMVLTADLRDLLMDFELKLKEKAEWHLAHGDGSKTMNSVVAATVSIAISEVRLAVRDVILENFPNQKPQTEEPCPPESKD